MHDLKYFLIILFSFLLTGFTSCINPESVDSVLSSLPSPEEEEGEIIPSSSSETSSEESESLAECMEGVYRGRTAWDWNFSSYEVGDSMLLEVSHNSNEMIFLVTAERDYQGQQLCTTYRNPSLSLSSSSSSEKYDVHFNLEGNSSIEHKGIISRTIGVFVSESRGEDLAAEQDRESMLCSINKVEIIPLPNTVLVGQHSSLEKLSPEDQELRSFAEIKSDCDALEPAQGGGATR